MNARVNVFKTTSSEARQFVAPVIEAVSDSGAADNCSRHNGRAKFGKAMFLKAKIYEKLNIFLHVFLNLKCPRFVR